MPEHIHLTREPSIRPQMYPPRPSRRKPHKERGVSSIAELLWNIYALKTNADLQFWFTKKLQPWLCIHWRKIHRIRAKLQQKHKDFLFLSWDDPRMKDPIVYSFGWYELFIALMTLTARDYERLLGCDFDDIEELNMDGTLSRLFQDVDYASHHVKVAIEILECLEEDVLRKHPIGAMYLSALNEASVYVLSIYGYSEWVTPIEDSKIEKDPVGTFLSWFQQPFSVIRARNGLNYKHETAQRDYSAHFQTNFGISYAHLPQAVIQEGIPSMHTTTENARENIVREEEVFFTEALLDESLEECPSSPPSCEYAVPYHHGPSVEIMGQNHYAYTEQPSQPDSSCQWTYDNQYDPYMGFTWDQDWNVLA